ncbi:Phage tail sheath protein [Haloferax larsenii]|uniref:Phage tail sheath protein n=1 Tax=Haloferax larsenii TaxID=302484 RepID=A0A1H7N3S8_HALLR|nr:Phage tail sheath protein [Haloferax larsenii]
MVSIGNSTLPGVQTTVDSATNAGVNVGASAQIALVGQADLANGTASADTVYEVRTPVKARDLFGSGSPLAENIVDALTEGAYPVYAAAPAAQSVTAEDLGTSQSGTLANAPVSEDPADVTFTVDGSDQTTVKTLEDPTTLTLNAGETAYNPVTGDYAHDVTPSTSSDVDYDYFDYTTAIQAVETEEAETVDFLGVLSEDSGAVQEAHDAVKRMEDNYNFAVAVAGADEYIADTSAFSNSYDSSRIQLLYPARDSDGVSIIGAYLGLRAALGINNSPIFKRLQTVKALSYTLSTTDQENLVAAKVVPVADESAGARIVEDLTCVADANSAEDNMRQVLHRLIVDYTTEIVNEVSEKFIGELHTQAARNALRSSIVARLGGLMDLNAITGYVVTVEEVDAMTASVDVGIDTIDPLRNINATVTAGAVA